MRERPSRQLPVRLPPLADELLSSWLCRNASFYAVPPLVMLQHCLPEVTSLRAADLDLSAVQAGRLANALSIEPRAVRAMTFATVNKASRRLIGAKPLQSCLHCGPALSDCRPILRSQLLGWRVTCPLCGEFLRDPDGSEVASPFLKHRQAALHGERLLNDEAERRKWTWASPVDIARLLLMRRVPRPPPDEGEFWRFRVLGAIIPELDDLVAVNPASLPTSGTLDTAALSATRSPGGSRHCRSGRPGYAADASEPHHGRQQGTIWGARGEDDRSRTQASAVPTVAVNLRI